MSMDSMIPPNSIPAEQAILGAVMLSNSALTALTISQDDFYSQRHRNIFAAMRALASQGEPLDIVTIAEHMDSSGSLDSSGGISYLGEIANNTPSAANIDTYSEVVKNHSEARQLRSLAGTLMSATGDTWKSVHDGVVRQLLSQVRGSGRWDCDIGEALAAGVDRIQEAHDANGLVGVRTGITRLDEVLGGFHPSDMIVIGARPAMGKTAFMLNLALNANCPIGIVSAEMPRDQLATRMIARTSRIDATRLRNADLEDHEWSRVTSGVSELRTKPIHILDKPAPSLEDVTAFARQCVHRHGISALYLDYLQRLKPENKKSPKHEQVGDIAMGLKELARDLDIPVIALAQVNRQVDSRPNHIPTMGDLKHSGEIEQEADVVILLYREEVYNDETEKTGVADLIVDKNRHGPTGVVSVHWDPRYMTFSDIPQLYAVG